MAIGQLGMTAAKAAIGGIIGIGLNKAGQKGQIEQQKKLQDNQIKGAKQMSDYEKGNQMDMWNKTNYGAQVAHMKDAGLNPGLMYGMGGGGAATTGGGSGAMPTGASAEGGSQAPRNAMDMAMMAAQTKMMESQARKNNVEADKTAGVDTGEVVQRTNESGARQKGISETTRGIKFDNDVKAMVGVDEFASAEGGKQRSMQETSRKERYVAEAWVRVMSQTEKGEEVGHTSEESRIYKNLVNDYNKAKSEGNLLRAEEVIKSWSTELIKDGMPPDSPWYYKLIERFINNASGGKLNLKDAGKALYNSSKDNELGDKVKKANYGR